MRLFDYSMAIFKRNLDLVVKETERLRKEVAKNHEYQQHIIKYVEEIRESYETE